MKLRTGTRPQGRRYTRYTLGGVVAGIVIAGIAVLVGGSSSGSHSHALAARPAAASLTASAPAAASRQPVTPAAAPVTRTRTRSPSSAGVSAAGTAGVGGVAGVAEVPDPEAAKSSPAPTTVHHAAATTPTVAASKAQIAPGAPSDAEVRSELAQMNAALKAQQQAQQAQRAPAGGGSIGGSGAFTPPPGVPGVIARVIAGGNAIADFPYVFGGGHASFVDSAYDCSGSVSYALAAGGMLSAPETSGQLMSWGAPGPGKWITVEASAGHVYMYVDGMRFDTSFRSGVFGSRWQAWQRTNVGFVARHWPGL